jgi:alkyldihydroxyacetonephosphate synthase
MKRWNGWGDTSIHFPLSESATQFLENKIGVITAFSDIDMETALAGVREPSSSLTPQPLIQTNPEQRLLHARGQSLPDWIALRSGRIEAYPDGVAFPSSSEEVRALLDYARQTGTRIIPYGGGTSVVGHINPLSGDLPIVTVDLSRLNRLIHFDEASHLATFGAGVRGPDLEAALRERGYTLGHFPQSFEYSTLGGWVAARSSGQQSYYYGRIEDLFAGGHVEMPVGSLALPNHPASAAGPDLRQMILGSEGRLGIISQATVPQAEDFFGVFFKDWESGVRAVQDAAQAELPLSMMRLSDSGETEANLALAGTGRLFDLAGRGLSWLGYGSERCLLIFAVTGTRQVVNRTRRQAGGLFRSHGGLPTGTLAGRAWRKNRFLTPYLRNTLWERGVAVDTLETAVPWADVLPAAKAIKAAVAEAAAETGERVLVIAHLSHMYRDGASIYVTYLFRRTEDPDELIDRWQKMKSAASRAIVAHGGTISHQHGVGKDHMPYLEAEKGVLGTGMLRAMSQTLDPQGLMNPGKLIQ